MSRKFNLKNLKTFICRNNSKIPATQHGYHDAKKQDVNLLYHKGYNIGLPMSLNKLICIDVDEKDGKTGIYDLTKLEEKLGKLPKTLKQKSCTGNGFHLIFSDEGIVNPKGKLGESGSIDIRWNGYILCEPSSINGISYKFIYGIDEYKNVIVEKLPVKWVDFINGEKVEKPVLKRKYSNKDALQCKYKPIKTYNLERIFSNCKFLQYCKDSAETLSENMWFSMISLLAQLKDSEILIHELSAPHPKYSVKETEYKIKRAKLFGKPQSCSYISKQYPFVCKECRYSREKGENNDGQK